jgi:hypothetical protein
LGSHVRVYELAGVSQWEFVEDQFRNLCRGSDEKAASKPVSRS